MTHKEAIQALYAARKAIDALLDAYESKQGGTSFDDWYALYPRKVGKPAARKAWKAKRLDSKAAQVIDRLKHDMKAWQDPKFIPYPATYLNQERYLDPIETPKGLRELTTEERLKLASR